MIELPMITFTMMAEDAAVGVLDDEAICAKYGTTLAQWEEIQSDLVFQTARDEIRRQLGDGGAEFKLYARNKIKGVIDALDDMMQDPDAPALARAKIAQLLFEVAGIRTSGGNMPTVGQQLIIQTNLSISQRPGVYELEAKGQVIEHESQV